MKTLRLGACAALFAAMAPSALAQTQTTSLDHTHFKWLPTGFSPCLLVAGRNFDTPVVHKTNAGLRFSFGADNGTPCPEQFMDETGPVTIRRITQMEFGPASIRLRDTKGRWYVVLMDQPNVIKVRRIRRG